MQHCPEIPMLDATLTAQLAAYLEKLQQPIELVASLDDSDAVSPASRWATNSPRWCWPCCRSAGIR